MNKPFRIAYYPGIGEENLLLTEVKELSLNKLRRYRPHGELTYRGFSIEEVQFNNDFDELNTDVDILLQNASCYMAYPFDIILVPAKDNKEAIARLALDFASTSQYGIEWHKKEAINCINQWHEELSYPERIPYVISIPAGRTIDHILACLEEIKCLGQSLSLMPKTISKFKWGECSISQIKDLVYDKY